MTEKKWDIFISHATEDKESFVAPLAKSLSAFGVSVWYDGYSLQLGDSLSRSIDEGLAKSEFGLVILSPAFFAKNWPEYELRGLTARELQGKKIILPIWHNVTFEDVVKYSPPLADKLAIRSTEGSPTSIAVSIIEVIRPDILTKIHRRMLHYSAMAQGKEETLETEEIMPSPIRHEELPDELVGRIRLVRAALLGVHTHSMEFWLDGFKRDSHPSREVSYWEHLAAVYLEYAKMTPLHPEQHDLGFKLLFSLQHHQGYEGLSEITSQLPEGALETLMNLYQYRYPIYDIEEELPWSQLEEPSQELLEFFSKLDKESFPKDLPEDLVRQLIQEIEEEEGGKKK